MRNALAILLLLGCEYDPQPASAPCRDLLMGGAQTMCPHPRHRLVIEAGGGCSSGRKVCRCEPDPAEDSREPEGT